jgi:hypothetical protein
VKLDETVTTSSGGASSWSSPATSASASVASAWVARVASAGKSRITATLPGTAVAAALTRCAAARADGMVPRTPVGVSFQAVCSRGGRTITAAIAGASRTAERTSASTELLSAT